MAAKRRRSGTPAGPTSRAGADQGSDRLAILLGSLEGDAAIYLDPAELTPWDRNPKAHDLDRVEASMLECGFGAPLVARAQDRRVVVGHGRLEVAKRLELPRVPVRLVDLTDEQAERLALADNRLSELGGWHDQALGPVLEDLAEQGVDLDALGWSDREVGRLLADLGALGPDTGEGEGEGADVAPAELDPTVPFRFGRFSGRLPRQTFEAFERCVQDAAGDLEGAIANWRAGQ